MKKLLENNSYKNRPKIAVLVFLLLAMVLSITSFFQTKIWEKRAEVVPLEAVFDITAKEPIKRIWTNFAQGGEEKKLMLKPAEKELRKLQPALIRIDHLFDFYDIIKKDAQGNLAFDFSFLDQRIEEITSLGATPYLSLSYFPQAISADPTKFPPSLQDWQTLVAQTVQRYSGKSGKNLWGVYYEVWNEPDLFGKMTPEVYLSLYQSSAAGSNTCQNCHPFKIGGPAITTLKVQTSWLDKFLLLIAQKKLRLDFISWHSYQLDPAKTAAEIEILKNLPNYKLLSPRPELIISEFGSVPEVSPLHDSYFDASHTMAAMAALKNSVDKVFSFELKDGPSPEQKKFWGRWGLLSHESFGLEPKPRFYTFLYLNQLLHLRLSPLSFSPDTWVIGSTDGKENFAIVTSRMDKAPQSKLFQIKLLNLLPGLYSANIYSLDPLHHPLTPVLNETSFSGGEFNLNFPSHLNGVNLIEIVRTSPSLVKAPGKTQNPNDFSAKLTSLVPPLVLLINRPGEEINSGEISFWFKPNWDKNDSAKHTLWETRAEAASSLSAWAERKESDWKLSLRYPGASEPAEEKTFSLAWQENLWHYLAFSFDNQKMIFSLKIDNQETFFTQDPNKPLRLGQHLYLGANALSQNSAEGLVDNLKIVLNGQTLYEKSFD